ncbi:MAG: plasmid partitioning protein RepB [Pseudorhizobium sp.]
MARKDVFANINSAPTQERKATAGYATRGASRSMVNSLSELADKAAKGEQMLAGETVIDLDPSQLDASFVSDRLENEDEAFRELVDAIRERGQDSPILVRPHPSAAARYQIVFGHRRARAAKVLGRPVRAVVKEVSDIEHVVAQGQENSARENLSFIERALFAKTLSDFGHDRSTIQSALSVDAPMLTRLLSVATRVPEAVVRAIGPAKGIGRDRWTELAQLIEHPSLAKHADETIAQEAFSTLASDARFERLVADLKSARRQPKPKSAPGRWQSKDTGVTAEFKSSGRTYAISLKAKDATRFGRYIAENLERLHQEFIQSSSSQGD